MPVHLFTLSLLCCWTILRLTSALAFSPQTLSIPIPTNTTDASSNTSSTTTTSRISQNLTLPPDSFIIFRGEYKVIYHARIGLIALPRDETVQFVSELPWRTRAGSLVWWLTPEEPTGVVTYLMVEASIEGTEQLVGQYGCSAEIRAYEFDIYDGRKKVAYGHMMMDVLSDSTSSNLTTIETSQNLTELTLHSDSFAVGASQNVTTPRNLFVFHQGRYTIEYCWMNVLKSLPCEGTARWISTLPESLKDLRRREGARVADPIPSSYGIRWIDPGPAGRLQWGIEPRASGGRLTYLKVETALAGIKELLSGWETASVPGYSFIVYDGALEVADGALMWVVVSS